jgi:hypothetical protein
MNHTEIVKSLSKFTPQIQYLQKNHPKIPFNLGEVGCALNPGVQNNGLAGVLGKALWTIDYLLYAMSMVSTLVRTGFLVLLTKYRM